MKRPWGQRPVGVTSTLKSSAPLSCHHRHPARADRIMITTPSLDACARESQSSRDVRRVVCTSALPIAAAGDPHARRSRRAAHQSRVVPFGRVVAASSRLLLSVQSMADPELRSVALGKNVARRKSVEVARRLGARRVHPRWTTRSLLTFVACAAAQTSVLPR